MPNFFLVEGLIVFPAFFFQILSPPLPPNMGSAVFLNIGLTQTCIGNDVPPMETVPKHQEDDKEMQN